MPKHKRFISALSCFLLVASCTSGPTFAEASKASEAGNGAKSASAKTESTKTDGSAKTEAASKKKSESAPAKHPVYKMAEPIADPAGSPTRVHRPGQEDGKAPPTAPPIGSTPMESPMPLLTPPPTAPSREKYPSVGQLEQLMFGHSTPNIVVDNRLDKLETAIFQKNYPDLDIEQRIKKLKEVVIGEDRPAAGADTYSSDVASASSRSYRQPPTASPAAEDEQPKPPFFPNYGHFDLNQELTIPEAEKFALDVINEVRAQQGVNELSWDELGAKVASEQVNDLVKRESVSHQNSKGENPDVRYSRSGGSDAIVESAIMFPAADNLKVTRELVVKMLEALCTRQDDRECLLFGHASGFAMSFKWTPNRHKLYCCTEVLTKHGQMEPIPLEASVGDKIEIKGNVLPPYKFHKITLAWEGKPGEPADDGSEATEALPYFPPLDYEAHAIKSNRDFDKGIRILQIAGITAAIAGGMFIPPVALAAPLIAASVGTSTPKPVSEIPIKGGVKSDGSNFAHKLTLSNQGKEGIYYLTVWASSGNGTEILPVSRRAIIASKNNSPDSASTESDKDKSGDNEKDKDKDKEAKDESKDSKEAKKAKRSKNKEDKKEKDEEKASKDSKDEPKGQDQTNADEKQAQPGS